MRARYYNTDIKRFINRDILSGDISNNQSLNEYCYVQGNPIKLTDPFGLCPGEDDDDDIKTIISGIIHGILDVAGFFFDGADILNGLIYALEGDYYMAATCAISAIPIVGSFIGTGAKAAILGMRVGTKISSEFVQTMFKTMSHTYKAGRAAGKVTDGALLLKAVVKESATSATKELAQFAVTHNAMIGMGVGFIGKNADEVVEGAAKVGRKSGSTSNLRLSEKVRELKNKGDYRQALDIHYEDLIRRKTGGQSQILQGREYDVVTDTKLIQAKRSNAAINNPNNFLKGSTRKQIKETARVANELGLQPEYWFKYGVHPKVREYIESKGIKVIIGFED